MSELQHDQDAEIRASSIEDSQPRQTLEQQRVKRLWESGCDLGGGDPYNTIGTRAFRPRAA